VRWCSIDDTSSISSGEISDAVAGVSTDDNITVGSSLSAHSFSADHRAAAAAGLASQRAAVLRMGSVTLQSASSARRGQAVITPHHRITPPVTATGPATGSTVYAIVSR